MALTTKNTTLLGFDVGERRIGVARGDTGVRLAYPLEYIEVDGQEIEHIQKLVKDLAPLQCVVGYPRNQSGEATAQTAFVEKFADKLQAVGVKTVFQDESVTSVLAEERLKQTKKPYEKGDIDAVAAAIILQDYIDAYC